ncbi:TetR/AcrR family transcriptional regulator [Kitasatospora sp. NBC_01250]|uniref:TetR/AcrR family transcriptional regulator n=1 Tax=unclassified Kitasatospora TaxID=2633591 RepID=UPI002E14E384|nr:MULTISPECIES: TetR/AcrR family transcriptional regulator [unclassified Kitasatospora]WSJ69711.1 TetR/AcrR family transcriptional regulator [Kitasatospora sp. NBC_01302]
MADTPRDPAVSIWVRPPKRAKRGSAPTGLSRDRIVHATVALLDAADAQSFSMRQLAAELDVTPMSVYWYVDNKDELLELALDHVLGETRAVALAEYETWRQHLSAMAHAYRDCFQRHPWAALLVGQFIALGPNSLAFSTSGVEAIVRTGLPKDQFSAALGLVFEYTYGFAVLDAQWTRRVRQSGLNEDEFYQRVHGVVQQVDPRFTENADVVESQHANGSGAARNHRFTQGLDLALAGIEATIAAARPRS